MVLVDTSVWIRFFRKKDPLDLLEHVDFDEIVTCLPVVQEVLQGIDEQRSYRQVEASMLALPVVESPLTREVFLEAASLYRTARRAAVTVRSSADCLIAACALRNDLEVLHDDRDFDHLSAVVALRARSVR